MNTTTHPVWILQAFDRAGNIIGTIIKHPNLPVVRKGDPGAFALIALCDIAGHFPEAHGECRPSCAVRRPVLPSQGG